MFLLIDTSLIFACRYGWRLCFKPHDLELEIGTRFTQLNGKLLQELDRPAEKPVTPWPDSTMQIDTQIREEICILLVYI
jgi:hypothetical protein